jgi:hypothetical protein
MLPMHEALTRFMLAASAKASAWIDMRNAFTEQAQRATHETTRRQLTTFAARATMRADAIMAVVEMARKRDAARREAMRRDLMQRTNSITIAANTDPAVNAIDKVREASLAAYPQPFPNAKYQAFRPPFPTLFALPRETVPAEYVAPDNPFVRMSQELFSAQFKAQPNPTGKAA